MINFYFHLYLKFYAYTARFDVTGNLENFLDFGLKQTRRKLYKVFIRYWKEYLYNSFENYEI